MDQLTLAQPPKRVSRDEMNLAEFPLTVLSTRAGSGVKTLEFSDSVRGRNGELVNRQWIITGADKFGLPTSSDDEVLLGLLKLTVDDAFRSRKIYFTRYELLKILRWTTEGRSYSRLQKALDRLSGVRIKATNAFYDNESKSHSTRNFGLIDAYEINDGRSTLPKPSFFVWSEVLFKSYQVGFIKKFDLDFYLNLKSAVSRRLYRYLDKHFWYKSRIDVNLFVLSHEKVGISRNYVYTSSLRQQLDPAVEELLENGFLSRYEYVGKGRDTSIILYAGSGKPRAVSAPHDKSSAADMHNGDSVEIEVSAAGTVMSDGEPLESLLISRGINPTQAKRLVDQRSSAELARMRQIVAHFDKLVASRSPLVSRSPVGFLYRAVQYPQNFVLPGEGSIRPKQAELALSRPAVSAATRESKRASLESEYLIARRTELNRIKEDIEPAMLKKLTLEVEEALHKVRGLISEDRFKETVVHGVEEKLAKLFAVPNFEEWSKKKKVA